MTVPPDMERLERVRHVTANYLDYQGLYMVLVGLSALMLLMLFAGDPRPLLFGVPVLVALGLVVRWYYRRRFGRVQALVTPGRVAAYALTPVALVVLPLVAAVVSARMDWTNSLIGVAGLVLAGVFVLLAYPGWSLRAHYLVAAGIVGLVSLLPLGPLMPSGFHPLSFASVGTLLVVLAVVLCVGGLLDHRTLVRTLPPVTENGTD